MLTSGKRNNTSSVTSIKSFKDETSFDERVVEFSRIRQKFPDRAPVIIERVSKANCVELDKRKFLVPETLRVHQLLYIIRKRLNLSHEQALYIYVSNKVLPMLSDNVGFVYQQYKDEDGFLYIYYDTERTFG